MTSVSPSHRPRELPSHCRTSPVRAGRPFERHDAHVVVHLEQQDDRVGRLEDLDVVVVAARQHRRSRAEPQQAALGDPALLGAGRPVAADPDADRLPVPGETRLLARFRLGRQRRDPAVRRIDDQRRLRQRRRTRAIRPDGLAVAARRSRRRREVARQRLGVQLLRQRRRLLVGQRVAVGEILRPLERRERPVVPHPAEVRVAPRRARRLRLRLGRGRRKQRQRRDERRQEQRSRQGSLHRASPRPGCRVPLLVPGHHSRNGGSVRRLPRRTVGPVEGRRRERCCRRTRI